MSGGANANANTTRSDNTESTVPLSENLSMNGNNAQPQPQSQPQSQPQPQQTSQTLSQPSANSNNGERTMTELEKLEKQLFEIVKFKENVGYFVWYLLVGLITTIASTNIVLSENCAVSKTMVDQAYKEFTESVKQSATQSST